jgi:glucokinase
MPDFSIGVDLGGTNLRIAAVSAEGHLLEKVTLGTKLALGRDHVIGEMCDAIQNLSAKYKATGNFLGAGIGLPGLIDLEAGMMRKAVNLPGWENYPARALPLSASSGWAPPAGLRIWLCSRWEPASAAASCSGEKSGTA